MPNPVVHFEILGSDLKKSTDFYSKIFSWKIDPPPAEAPYSLAHSKGEYGIDGGIGEPMDGKPRACFYVEVADINKTLNDVEANGGKTMQPRTDIGYVVIAMFTDLDGNEIGLIENPDTK